MVAHGLSAAAPLSCRNPSSKEQLMRLNQAQVEQTLTQFEAQPLPDNHPAVPHLNNLFGDHTFFLDSSGLNVLEPAATPDADAAARIVNLANWTDENLTSLTPHEPEPTGRMVVLGSMH
jgi:hypothetical protein